MAEEVVKAEDSQLREYELVLVISPEVADEAVEARINSLGELIAGSGGSVSRVERWGKRKLAYPLKHFLEGNYVLTQLSMSPALSKQLEANLKISEDVLRHLLISLSVD